MPDTLNIEEVYSNSYECLKRLMGKTKIPIYNLIISSTIEELMEVIYLC